MLKKIVLDGKSKDSLCNMLDNTCVLYEIHTDSQVSLMSGELNFITGENFFFDKGISINQLNNEVIKILNNSNSDITITLHYNHELNTLNNFNVNGLICFINNSTKSIGVHYPLSEKINIYDRQKSQWFEYENNFNVKNICNK